MTTTSTTTQPQQEKLTLNPTDHSKLKLSDAHKAAFAAFNQKFKRFKFSTVEELINQMKVDDSTLEEFMPQGEIITYELCLEAVRNVCLSIQNPFVLAQLIARVGFSKKINVKIGDTTLGAVLDGVGYLSGGILRFFAPFASVILLHNQKGGKCLYRGGSNPGDFYGSHLAGGGMDKLQGKKPEFFSTTVQTGYEIFLKGALVSTSLGIKPLYEMKDVVLQTNANDRIKKMKGFLDTKHASGKLTTEEFVHKFLKELKVDIDFSKDNLEYQKDVKTVYDKTVVKLKSKVKATPLTVGDSLF